MNHTKREINNVNPESQRKTQKKYKKDCYNNNYLLQI